MLKAISFGNKKKCCVKDVRSAIAEYAAQLRRLLGADLRDVLLFGSRATGTHRPTSRVRVGSPRMRHMTTSYRASIFAPWSCTSIGGRNARSF